MPQSQDAPATAVNWGLSAARLPGEVPQSPQTTGVPMEIRGTVSIPTRRGPREHVSPTLALSELETRQALGPAARQGMVDRVCMG